jgi:DNA-binding phage protein
VARTQDIKKVGRKENKEINMPLSRSYKETIKARVERDPAFRAALFEESIKAFLEGDTSVGKALLRDLVNSTIGFEGLADELHKPSKSLHRMLAPAGNPTMENLFQVIHALKQNQGIDIEFTSTVKRSAKVRKNTAVARA